MSDLDELDIGMIMDMWVEKANDSCEYAELATQEDMNRF
jgi:hypothetical protein